MSSDNKVSHLQEAGTEPAAESALNHPSLSTFEASEGGNPLEDMETLSPSPLVPGQIVQGKVVKVTDDEVLIDIGLKSEAALPRSEFLSTDGRLMVAVGDPTDLWIEQYDETTGAVAASHQKAVRRRVWEEIERAFQKQTLISGRVVERIKGGLTVEVGVRAFLPASHADTRPHSNLDELLGQEISCKVIKFNRKRNNVVVSRKLAIEEERNQRKAELVDRLVEGAELVGTVKNLTDYGAFVDLGGMDGLLHVTDLSWGRVRHASEVVQVGQEIRVKLLKYDREKGRVSLGLKQLTPDPWEQVSSAYHAGDRVTGRTVSLTNYGAFVELEAGVEGLLHISEMSWSRRLRHPSKILEVGERVEVGVLEVDVPKRRISLSLKAVLPDPWAGIEQRFTVGSVVQGRVRNLTEFGAFVEIEEGVDGLIHLSNLSWNHSVQHPSEVLKKGQKVEAIVLALDPAHHRLALGLKQLGEDPWQRFFAKTQVGDVLRGKVSRLASFGAFVELQEGIEGLCHSSQFADNRRAHAPANLQVGSEYKFRVIRLSPADRKIGLSMKEAVASPAPAGAEKPKETTRASTIAEALSSAGISPVEPSTSSPAPDS
jgi:small subunit ribosomal protein S1